MKFHDLFSEKSELYAAARPRYPAALFRWIAAMSPGNERAWDCGTGNGQAAVGLARVFQEVHATDASEAQISNAAPCANVHYSIQHSERTRFADVSMDAVCAAQALHWFDFAQFFPEVNRVLRTGGFFAAWWYNWFEIEDAIDAKFKTVILDVVAPFWASQNALVWNGYKEVPFPYPRIEAPRFEMECSYNVMQFFAFVHTWSAVQRCMKEKGPEFFESAIREIGELWGDPESPRTLRMPIVILAGKKS